MIAHVVLMRPRTDLSPDDRLGFLRALERAVREIPAVRAARIGRRVMHGAAYETTAPPLDYVATIEFDDVAGLQEYLGHPAHQQLGELFGRLLSSAMVFDFEVGGIDEVERIVR